MSSNTTNYNLHKIDLTDAPPDITVLNGNWDTIDAQLKSLSDNKAAGTHIHGVATTTSDGFMSKEDKAKLEGLADYAHPTYTARTGKPTANQTPGFGGTFTISQITSDSTGHVSGMTDRTVKIPNAVATTSAAGLMSADMVTKLNGITAGANKTTVDDALSTTSTNPVQNKVITNVLVNHGHNYAGSSSNGGSATSAVKLQTARTLTIGSSGKSFDGTADVTWSLSDIGAATSEHNHNANEITTGTLATARLPLVTVSKGGTGKTSLTSGYFLRGNGTGSVTLTSPTDTLTAIGGVPTSRKVNGNPLTNDVTLSASDIGASKIIVGSYIGTDTYGESNPNTLTFTDAPNAIIMLGRKNRSSGNWYSEYVTGVYSTEPRTIMVTDVLSTTYTKYAGFAGSVTSGAHTCGGKKSSDGKTIYWYHTVDSVNQYNSTDFEYYYMAIFN